MNYQTALAMHDELEAAANAAYHTMSKYPVEGPMKLTPDHIKRTPEFQKDWLSMQATSKALRDFNNKIFLKLYRKEWQATLSERRAARAA